MYYNNQPNKLYLIINKSLSNKKLILLFKNIKEFKSIGYYNIDDDNIYFSFNFNDNKKIEENDLKPYINKINNILIKFNINVNIYYNYNDIKTLIYKYNIEPLIINKKITFIDDDD